MVFLVLAALLLAIMAWYLVKAVRGARTDRRIRRVGVQVDGEIVRMDAEHRTGGGAGYLLTPVARYRIAGRVHEAPVVNGSGSASTGSAVQLLVDPDSPYEPFVLGGDSGGRDLWVGGVGVGVGVVLTVLAAVHL